MLLKDLPVGAHFWGIIKSNGESAVFLKANETYDGYYVAGSWEGSFGIDEIEFVEIIAVPDGVKSVTLYYAEGILPTATNEVA